MRPEQRGTAAQLAQDMGRHTLTARAYDAAWHVPTSAGVMIQVK